MNKEKVNVSITKQDIENLLKKLESGEVSVGDNCIMYSDYINREGFPKLALLPVLVPGVKANYVFTELTSYCPATGQPDFGTIEVEIVPNEATIEMKSLRNYLIGYRNCDIYQEEICANVLIDVVRACNPKYAKVKGTFTPRGAMTTIGELEYYEDSNK